MTDRTFWPFAGLLVLLVAGQVTMLAHLQRQDRLASIECRATNAGVPLAAKDGRVYVYPAGRHEEVIAEGTLRQALRMPPGRYDVRVLLVGARDRHSVWLTEVTLAEGERVVRHVDFSAGELSVDGTVGATSAAPGQVAVYLFMPSDHDRMITSMGPGERAVIGAGVYDLRVVLTIDAQEKEVRWLRGVPVQAGLHTTRTVSFQRGAIRVTAHNARKPLPPGTVTLTLYRAGDLQQEVFDSGPTGVPLGLPVGRYDVRAIFVASNDKPSRWLRGIEVRDDEVREETVDFASGTVVVSAEVEGGDPLPGFQVYIYYYRADDHTEPLTYTPAGQPAVLQSGRYDVRAHFFRSHDRPDIWMRGVVVEAGQVVRETVRFRSGRLLLRAYDGSGRELVGDNVFVYVHPAGRRARPIAVARSGEMLFLIEGLYDIRVEDTRTADREVWLTGVRVQAGALTEKPVAFRPGGGTRP